MDLIQPHLDGVLKDVIVEDAGHGVALGRAEQILDRNAVTRRKSGQPLLPGGAAGAGRHI